MNAENSDIKWKPDHRQAFIWAFLTEDFHKTLSAKDVQNLFGKTTTKKTMELDARALTGSGRPVIFDRSDDTFRIDTATGHALPVRFEKNRRAKRSVAKAAVSLIRSGVSNDLEFVTQLPEQALIRIGEFSSSTSRSVALDSGSTALYVAKSLRKMSTPIPGSPLASVTILTNGLANLVELSMLDCSHEVIALAGSIRKDAASIGGELINSTLENLSIRPQLGLVAMSQLSPSFNACCNHIWDAQAKRALISACQIRCLIADSEKLDYQMGAFEFATLMPPQIDLIITDDGVKVNETFLSAMQERKVGVAIERSQ